MYKTRGRGNPLKEDEKIRIKELYAVLGNKKAVASAVNRSSWTVGFVLGTRGRKPETQMEDVFFNVDKYYRSNITI